jgi:hypothetical protein
MAVAKLTSSGALDPAFDGPTGTGNGIAWITMGTFSSDAFAMTIADDGDVIVGGSTEPLDDASLVRLDGTSGALDPAFDGPGGSGNGKFIMLHPDASCCSGFTGLELQPDGSLIGSFHYLHFTLSRTGADIYAFDAATGTLDNSFSDDGRLSILPGQDYYPTALVPLSDGSLLIGGKGNDAAWANITSMQKLIGTPVADHDDDNIGGDSNWTEGTQHFGACLRSVANGATSDWVVAASCPATNGSYWNDVPIAPEKIAHTIALEPDPVDATANLRFGLRTAPNQPPGRYTAPITFQVVAPNA